MKTACILYILAIVAFECRAEEPTYSGDLKCFNNTDCDSMFECIDEECVCKEEFYNDGDNCTRRFPPLGDCSNITNKCIKNASCVYNETRQDSVCLCDSYFYTHNGMCLPEILPQEICIQSSPVHQCVLDASCVFITGKSTSVCTCDDQFYTFNSKCNPVSNLISTNVTISRTETSNITVTWMPPEVGNFSIKYKIETSSSSAKLIITTSLKYTLTDLIPGSVYSISVRSMIKDEANTTKGSPSVNITQQTYPDKPAITNITNSVSKTLMFFWTVKGNFDEFRGTLCNLPTSQCQNFTTNETSVTFNNLKSNSEYKLSVRARKGNLEGETTVACKRTIMDVPNSVSNLTLVDLKATSFSVMFSYSAKTIAYQIAVNNSQKKSSHCVLLIINRTSCTQLTNWVNCSQTSEFSLNKSSVLYSGFVDAIPDSEYTVTVWSSKCLAARGRSPPTSVFGKTKIAVPGVVSNIAVNNTLVLPISNQTSAVSVNVSWLSPHPRPGPTNYTLTVCDAVNNITYSRCFREGYENTSCLIEDLLPFWEYRFMVFAETSAGKSSTVTPDVLVTPHSDPGLPKSVRVLKDTRSYRLAQLKMMDPDPADRNTFITGYTLNVVSNQSQQNFTKSSFFIVGNLSDANSRRTNSTDYVFHFDVIPGNSYKLWLSTLGRYNTTSDAKMMEYHAVVGRPPVWRGSQVAGPALQQTTSSLVVEFSNATFFNDSTNGRIQNQGVIISDFYWKPSDGHYNISGRSFQIPSWQDAQKKLSEDFPYLYQVVFKELKVQQNGKLQIKLGQDGGCVSKASVYCNGKLRPGTTYYVRGFACTVAGCTLTPSAGPFRTTGIETVSDGVFAGIFVPLLIVVVLITAGFWLKRRTRAVSKRSTSLSLVHINVPRVSRSRPVKLSKLKAKVADMHNDSNLLFALEYGDISRLSPDHPTNASQLDENKQKNRFTNVIPFDHSRVLLTRTDEDDETSDYVNANYIDGYNKENEYIAAQGPLPSTVDDFWRMIWEQNVAIIVMVTPLKEGGKIKCEQYWPKEVFDPRQYGEVVVENTSSSTVNTYNLSVFRVKHTQNADEVHTVYHFHFLNWRDMTADLEAHNLIDFVKTVRSYVRADMKGPMLVHCSAGVGRTGTFITIDYLSQFIKEHDLEEEVNIFGFVLKMRDRRVIMVQAEAQYIFIHDAAVDLIDEKIKALTEVSDSEDLYVNTPDVPLYVNITDLSYKPQTTNSSVDVLDAETGCVNAAADLSLSENNSTNTLASTQVTNSLVTSSTTMLITTEL